VPAAHIYLKALRMVQRSLDNPRYGDSIWIHDSNSLCDLLGEAKSP
jgi:hypothetical protein